MMRIDPLPADIAFRRVTKVGRSASGDLVNILAYNFSTATLQGYTAARLAEVKHEKVLDCPVESLLKPAVAVNCILCMIFKMRSDVERNYW